MCRSRDRRFIRNTSIRRRIVFGSYCYENFFSVFLTHKYIRDSWGRWLILHNHLSLMRWERIFQNDRCGWSSFKKTINFETTQTILCIILFFANETRIFRLALLCILNRLSFGFLLLWGNFLSISFSIFLTSRLLRFTDVFGIDHINLGSFTRSSSRRWCVLSGSSRSSLRVRLTRRFTRRVLGNITHYTVSGVRFCRRYSIWISRWARSLRNHII